MASPDFAILFSAQTHGAGATGSPGDALLPITPGGLFVRATSANRGARRTTGIALAAYGPNQTVEIQQQGLVDYNTFNLGAGAASWVRVNAAGSLERATVSGSDDVVGACDADGALTLACGFITAGMANGTGGSSIGLGTALQYLRTNAGANATEWATPIALPLTYPDGGTGLTALGTALQVLRTNAGVSAMEWWTIPGTGTSVTTAVNATLTNAQSFCRVTAAGKTITLPASPVDGQLHEIKTAGAFTCDVAGNGHNIDGAASYTQGVNRENTRLRYDAGAGEWEIR